MCAPGLSLSFFFFFLDRVSLFGFPASAQKCQEWPLISKPPIFIIQILGLQRSATMLSKTHLYETNCQWLFCNSNLTVGECRCALIPAHRVCRQRLSDLCRFKTSGLPIKFQDSQDYIVRTCLKTKKKTLTVIKPMFYVTILPVSTVIISEAQTAYRQVLPQGVSSLGD